VFLLDKKRNMVTLDLETRRMRPSLEQVRQATVGPDGALYVVDIGILRATARRPQAVPGTGTVWRIHRVGR
jgi:hypothetical protein